MSKIEWTGLTWNPTTGCDKVSAGCKFCYAEIMHRRLRAMGQKKYDHKFLGDVRIHIDELDIPLKRSKPTVYFVNSMSDLFHESIPLVFIAEVYKVMRQCQHHTFQILTKRPERALEFYREYREFENLPNVWLGTSCENQEQFYNRISYLIITRVAVRFLSCEPLLGPLDLNLDLRPEARIHWVIVGGESGIKKGVRPMHPDWVREIRDQCQVAGVPFFFKQWGAWHESDLDEGKGIGKTRRHLFPDGKLMYRMGKDKTGNILDGRQHLEMPTI